MKSRLTGLFLLSACFVVVFAHPVLAATETGHAGNADRNVTSTLKKDIENRDTRVKTDEAFARKENRKTEMDVRCASTTARTNARIGFYNDRKQTHLEQYQNTHQRIQKLTTQLEARGYDTIKMKQSLVELDRLIAKAAANYAVFIAKLEASKSFNCATGTGDYAQALKEAQIALDAFKKDVLAIRNFLQSTFKTDLEALKGQKRTQETNTR